MRWLQKALLLPVRYEKMRRKRAEQTELRDQREIWDEIERLGEKWHEMQRKNNKTEVIRVEGKIEALYWICQEQNEYNL